MPDGASKGRHPAFCFCPCNQESQIDIPQFPSGGIAQLVERQLCKLEVRGSNPLASTLIFDCGLPISDLQKSARKRGGNEASIDNLKCKIRRRSRRNGPVAQLVRACA